MHKVAIPAVFLHHIFIELYIDVIHIRFRCARLKECEEKNVEI